MAALLLQTALELSLPVYSQFAERRLNAFLEKGLAGNFIITIVAAVAIYLVAAFLGLRFEKTIIIRLVNDLREYWFSLLLFRSRRPTSKDKAKLLAKLTYHFSLLQGGVGAAVTGFIRWLINYCALLVLGFFAGPLLFSYVLVSFFVCLGLGISGYYIGLFYLSREASLSTAIISHISQSIDQAGIIQAQFREKTSLERLSELVVLDSALKVRRTLWLEYGNRIIFALLVLIGACVSMALLFAPNVAVTAFIPKVSLSSGILFAFLARQLYLSLRIGLYVVPTKIGLVLSLPEAEQPAHRSDSAPDFNAVHFSSRKVKLISETEYIKDVSFIFKRKGRYHIYGEGRVGKSALARIFSGQARQEGRPWIVRLDGRRFRYPLWRKVSQKSFLVDGVIGGGPLIGEIISGCDRLSLRREDIADIMDLVERTPELSFLSHLPKFTATEFDQAQLTKADGVLLQLAFCLFHRPRLIVVDNAALDMPDPRIISLLSRLNSIVQESIIICFSTQRRDIMNFSEIYEIKKNTVVRIEA